MNTQVHEVFRRSEGRYLNDQESQTLLTYAENLLAQLDTMQALERAEATIIEEVVRAVGQAYPDMSKDHGAIARDLVRRDQTMLLRYASFGALLQDKNFIYDKLAVWLRTILFALCDVRQVVFGMKALLEACNKHLSPVDAERVVGHIAVVLTEFETNMQGAVPAGKGQAA